MGIDDPNWSDDLPADEAGFFSGRGDFGESGSLWGDVFFNPLDELSADELRRAENFINGAFESADEILELAQLGGIISIDDVNLEAGRLLPFPTIEDALKYGHSTGGLGSFAYLVVFFDTDLEIQCRLYIANESG